MTSPSARDDRGRARLRPGAATRRSRHGPRAALGAGAWVILPTYNEAENLPGHRRGDPRRRCPAPSLLVVDDGSPDGTGELADGLAAADPRVRVKHRAAKQGLGRAYLDGFGEALGGGATTVVQMDADWSHDPKALPSLIAPIDAGTADLVIGSRYTKGGGVEDWGIVRRIISRGGSIVRPDRPRPQARTTSPAGSRRGAPRRSTACRSTASARAGTCSRSR